MKIRKSGQNGEVSVKSKALLHYFGERTDYYKYTLPEISGIFSDIMKSDINKINAIVLNKICSALRTQNITVQTMRTRWKELVDFIFSRRKHVRAETVKVTDVMFLLHMALDTDDTEAKSIWQKVKTAFSMRLLDVQDDSVMGKLYNNDLAGLYFYDRGNSLFNQIYRNFYTDDRQTIEKLSTILEKVHHPLNEKELYIPEFLIQETDGDSCREVYRLSPMKLTKKTVSSDLRFFLGNLDIYMMWLDEVEAESLSLLKQKDANIDDVAWCLKTIYEAVKRSTGKMQGNPALAKEIKTALKKCTKELESQAMKVKKYAIMTEPKKMGENTEEAIFFRITNE